MYIVYIVCLCIIGRVSFQLGSDGESEEASANSDDKDLSPVRLRNRHRRYSEMASHQQTVVCVGASVCRSLALNLLSLNMMLKGEASKSTD